MTVVKAIDKYGGGTVLFAGTVGNVLCICVLCRKRFRYGVSTTFMLAMAVGDACSLLFGQGGRHWVRGLTRRDLSNENDWHCKAWFQMTTWAIMSSNWMLAAFSVERCIAVKMPLQAKRLLTRRNSVVGLVAIVTALFAYTCQYNVTFGTKGGVCVLDIENYYAREVSSWLDLFIQSASPGFIIVTCNIIIIATLVQTNAKRKKLHGMPVAVTGSDPPENLRLRSTIPMLVAVSVAFVFLTAPLQLKWILDQAFPASYETFGKEAANNRLMWATLVWLVYVNNAINFLLYLVSGREFRHEMRACIKELLSCFPCAPGCYSKDK